MNVSLTAQVKRKALEMGADLVGIGNVERWDKAPLMMSPKGLMPQTRSVIVLALHHGDAVVEMGGEKHPQVIGPYNSQYFMNDYLDFMSFEMARFLERAGCQALPITASNIWRYNTYKDLKAIFAPDISHIYSAVGAGLSEMGYNGLSITPEFGARNRFVTILTDAELTPDPLLPGNSLCDRCLLCVKHCPSAAMSKEVVGEVALEIEGNRYPFANKNLWRCSWGEHFNLDLDLPIPDKVDEAVLLENLKCHGQREGEMGQCLKFCLPKNIREWDRSHTSSPRRKRYRAQPGQELSRGQIQRLTTDAFDNEMDVMIVADGAGAGRYGLNLTEMLPTAQRLVIVGTRAMHGALAAGLPGGNQGWAGQHLAGKVAFFTARRLESMGYDAASYVRATPETSQAVAEILGGHWGCAFVVTSAPVPVGITRADTDRLDVPADLTATVKALARACGADVVGISPAGRLEDLAAQLRPIYDGQEILAARRVSPNFRPVQYEVSSQHRKVRTPGEYVLDVKSVIVLGVAMPSAAVGRLGQPPAEAVGPYAFAMYQANRVLQEAALRLTRKLKAMGFNSVATEDLTGTGSRNANPRGEQADAFSNRFAAVCAGLGTLGKGGFVLHPQYGPNLRFMAIVTDAELTADPVGDLSADRRACDAGCDKCLCHCTAGAFGREATVGIEGQELTFSVIEQKRCDWAKRYALVGDEGLKYLGSKVDIAPPKEITPDVLGRALGQHDPIIAVRMCVAEMCLAHCPMAQRS